MTSMMSIMSTTNMIILTMEMIVIKIIKYAPKVQITCMQNRNQRQEMVAMKIIMQDYNHQGLPKVPKVPELPKLPNQVLILMKKN